MNNSILLLVGISVFIGFLGGLMIATNNKENVKFYCTTQEHDDELSINNRLCGFPEGYSDEYGGLVKIDGQWINRHWLKEFVSVGNSVAGGGA